MPFLAHISNVLKFKCLSVDNFVLRAWLQTVFHKACKNIFRNAALIRKYRVVVKNFISLVKLCQPCSYSIIFFEGDTKHSILEHNNLTLFTDLSELFARPNGFANELSFSKFI